MVKSGRCVNFHVRQVDHTYIIGSKGLGILGEAYIYECKQLDSYELYNGEDREQNMIHHQVEFEDFIKNFHGHSLMYIWKLRDVKMYDKPSPYKVPKGCVTWCKTGLPVVNIEEDKNVVESPEQRAERIFKEDDEKREMKYQVHLKENQLRREKVVEKYKEFLNNMYIEKPKNKYCKWFCAMLMKGAETTFENDDDEYEFIGKYGRGVFKDNYIRKFNKQDQDIIKEIATEFGAFDY